MIYHGKKLLQSLMGSREWCYCEMLCRGKHWFTDAVDAVNDDMA